MNERRCVSCRKVASRDLFWRIVRNSADNTIQLDQGMGRSAYLCPTLSCYKLARQKRRLERALKASVPDQIYEQLYARL